MLFRYFDNFLENPDEERKKALSSTYETQIHNGLTYHGISRCEDPRSQMKILELLGITPKSTNKWITFFRRYMKDEVKETFIHPDAEIGQITALLYLNEPKQCFGGTAFWKHKLYKWHMQPFIHELEPLGLKDEPKLWKSILEDGFDESKWKMVDYIPMLYNRLIVFDSRLFHSRYPKTSFGSTIDNARLVKVFFFTP